MTDHDKPWRLPDAKPITFDEMTARAQYWYNAALIGTDEIAELREENERLRKRVEAADALAEKLEKAVKTLERQAEAWSNALELDIIAERHRTSAYLLMQEARATLAEITGGKTDG